MEFKKYIDSLERGGSKNLARKLNISKSFLSQITSSLCAISLKRCVEIALVTYSKVSRKDLRLNDWYKLWLELIAA